MREKKRKKGIITGIGKAYGQAKFRQEKVHVP